MYAKIEITGTIEVITGMHIGGSTAFSAIGAVDSPVIKETISGKPMITGSSFKGKLSRKKKKKYNTVIAETPDDDDELLLGIFGSAKNKKAGRLIFSDMILSNKEELEKKGAYSRTEIKFENSIKRTTGVANPRQIERVIRGSKFPMSLIYEVSQEQGEENILRDFQVIKDGFKILEYDYLGGSGTRGYGKIKFCNIEVNVAVGDLSDNVIDECNKIFEEFEE